MKKDYLDTKQEIFEGFKFFGDTRVGQFVPMGKDLEGIDFVKIGAFNPVKLLGWFEEVVTTLSNIKDTDKSMAFRSTGFALKTTKYKSIGQSKEFDSETITMHNNTLESNDYHINKQMVETQEGYYNKGKKFNDKSMIRRTSN